MRSIPSFLFAVVLTHSVEAAAAPAKDEFQATYEQASESYQAGRFSEAITHYQSAYRVRQLPRLLLMIGKSHLKLGHAAEARHHFQWFLDAKPDAPESEEVKRLLQQCQKMLAPPKADEPPQQSGSSDAEAAASRDAKGQDGALPAPAQGSELTEPGTTEAEPTPIESRPQDESGKEQRRPLIGPGGGIALGISGVLAATAVGLGVGAEAKARSAESTLYHVDTAAQAASDTVQIRGLTTAAIVTGVAAATLLITTGAVLGARARRPPPKLSMLPWAGGRSLGLSLSGRY